MSRAATLALKTVMQLDPNDPELAAKVSGIQNMIKEASQKPDGRMIMARPIEARGTDSYSHGPFPISLFDLAMTQIPKGHIVHIKGHSDGEVVMIHEGIMGDTDVEWTNRLEDRRARVLEDYTENMDLSAIGTVDDIGNWEHCDRESKTKVFIESEGEDYSSKALDLVITFAQNSDRIVDVTLDGDELPLDWDLPNADIDASPQT